VPENIVVGDILRNSTGSLMTVVEVTGEVVRLDANHPFVGKALNFEIELLAIE
jgi:FKBP-type peptidyl-prolyl cis-trans isomerase 2